MRRAAVYSSVKVRNIIVLPWAVVVGVQGDNALRASGQRLAWGRCPAAEDEDDDGDDDDDDWLEGGAGGGVRKAVQMSWMLEGEEKG